MMQTNTNDMILLNDSDNRSPLGFHETPQRCLTDRTHAVAMASGSLSHFNLPTQREGLMSLAP